MCVKGSGSSRPSLARTCRNVRLALSRLRVCLSPSSLPSSSPLLPARPPTRPRSQFISLHVCEEADSFSLQARSTFSMTEARSTLTSGASLTPSPCYNRVAPLSVFSSPQKLRALPRCHALQGPQHHHWQDLPACHREGGQPTSCADGDESEYGQRLTREPQS